MKRSVLLLVVAIAPLWTQSLSRGERDFAMSHLHASRKLFLDAIAPLSEAQWKFKPSADRWSIAQCAEHVALSEDALFQVVTENVMKSEPTAGNKPASREKDQKVIAMVRDRSQKAKAPKSVQPSERWGTRRALVRDFKKSRDRTVGYVETTQDDLRGHSGAHPVGLLDAYQWLLLISAHAERHTAQINEVKQHPDFPEN
jgi:uncharacterized damage-inducible protein DinB